MSDDIENSSNPPGMSTPWPQAGDVLFQAADDWWNNACLGCYRGGEVEIYASGYKRAADLLSERVFESRDHVDSLVYPIVFLYRHYLELRLKEIIVSGQSLLDSPPDLKLNHKLDELWVSCRRILEEVWSDSTTDDLDAVEDCLKEFAKTDPNSIGFRYPTTKEGGPSLTGLKHINIRNLYAVMERISSLLEGASGYISAHLDYKCSAQRDYYGPP